MPANDPEPTEHYVDRDDIVANDDFVYRRIRPGAVDWSALDAEGYPKIEKNAFSDAALEQALALGCPARAMSLTIGAILEQHGLDPAVYLLQGEWVDYGLVRLQAGTLRHEQKQGIQPWQTDEDIAHGLLFTRRAGATKRGASDEKRTREAAEWVVLPETP